MKSYWAQSFCWLTNTPYRSLERAYKASKQIRSIKNDYISYKSMVSFGTTTQIVHPNRWW